MLTRLYIDNFRCFEKFEWRPGRKQLILGRNGTGKTSLRDALQCVVEAVLGGERVEKLFSVGDRTQWMDQQEQVIDIEVALAGGDYRYMLVVEPSGEPPRPRIQAEILYLNGKPLMRFEGGKVFLDPSDPEPMIFPLDQNRSALSALSEAPSLRGFRGWLSGLYCVRVNPLAIGSRAENEQVDPLADLTNFPAWYRHLALTHPRENVMFLQDLRQCLDGFDQLALMPAGENVRILTAEFVLGKASIKIPFGGLSDGQRCLICLYAITHFVVAKGGTVIIDEPDNFISLREIQPWLMGIEDIADDHKGQVILISHHPEILNQWANPYGVQFVREGAGPVRVEKFKGDPEGSLTAAEVVAEGWDFD